MAGFYTLPPRLGQNNIGNAAATGHSVGRRPRQFRDPEKWGRVRDLEMCETAFEVESPLSR